MAKLNLTVSPSKSSPRRFAKAGTGTGKKAEGFVLNERTLQHGNITAASQASPAGCCTKLAGIKGCKGPPRPGQVDLAFYPRPKARSKKKIGIVGPALRLCVGRGKSRILPVKDPHEARKIAADYQACVGGDQAKVETCAAKFAGESAPLAGLRRRKAR